MLYFCISNWVYCEEQFACTGTGCVLYFFTWLLEHTWILYSRGRVWVHHLSLSSDHCQSAVATTTDCHSSSGWASFLLFVYVCKWVARKKPMQERQSAVATTANRHFDGGLNSSWGGELKLYLDWKRNTCTPSKGKFWITYFKILGYFPSELVKEFVLEKFLLGTDCFCFLPVFYRISSL